MESNRRQKQPIFFFRWIPDHTQYMLGKSNELFTFWKVCMQTFCIIKFLKSFNVFKNSVRDMAGIVISPTFEISRSEYCIKESETSK
jgi:hypothetical protein